MNGIHDMGGMQDMGPIQRETREPVFHAEWERRVFALFNALGVGWPARRQQIELIPPADYLRMSYYERWLAAIGPLMVDTGMMTRQEIESGNVKARMTLDANGNVTRVEVVEAQPRRLFDRAVVRALSNWRFNEGPSGRTVETEVEFKLK